MTHLHAQPYDISATGFYFETVEQYRELAAKVVIARDLAVEYSEIVIAGEKVCYACH